MSKQAISGEGVSRMNAFMVPPEQILLVEDPNNPLYDERVKLPINEAMVASIMAYGVRVPVLVRKADDKIVCVAGRQRIKNAIEANKRLVAEGKPPIKVPVLREDGTDGELFGVTILENELREDDKILTKARKAQRMLAMPEQTKANVAVTFGVTQATLDNWAKLLSATPAVLRSVEAEDITPTAAYRLATLPAAEQDQALAELLSEEDGGTAASAARKVSKSKKGAKSRLGRPSIKKIGKLHELLVQTLQGLNKKDTAYVEMATAVEILDYVLTGESGEFVSLAFAGLSAAQTPRKPKAKPAATAEAATA